MPETVTVHFATNREEIRKRGAITGFGTRPHQSSALWLRYGAAEMKPGRDGFSLAELRVAEERLSDGAGVPPDTIKLGSDSVFDGLRQRMTSNRADLVTLIHGFACTFENALANAAELKAGLGTAELPIETAVFSWPSDGQLFPFWAAYYADRKDARDAARKVIKALREQELAKPEPDPRRLRQIESEPLIGNVTMRDDGRAAAKPVERALLRLRGYLRDLPSEDACRRNLHLVAHSMGNYVLRNTLQALISDLGERRLPRLFKNIFLMAADEDDDAFEHADKFARLPELADAVHVYFARNDRALTISDVTKGNRDRLGSAGPRNLAALPQKVVLVDCTDVSDVPGVSDVRHQYYRARPEVLADVQAVLRGTPPHEIANREWVPQRSCWRIKPAG